MPRAYENKTTKPDWVIFGSMKIIFSGPCTSITNNWSVLAKANNHSFLQQTNDCNVRLLLCIDAKTFHWEKLALPSCTVHSRFLNCPSCQVVYSLGLLTGVSLLLSNYFWTQVSKGSNIEIRLIYKIISHLLTKLWFLEFSRESENIEKLQGCVFVHVSVWSLSMYVHECMHVITVFVLCRYKYVSISAGLLNLKTLL